MAKVIAGMTLSLDGFAADDSGSAEWLYPDLRALRDTPYMRSMIEETGAVLMGRHTFEMGDPDWYAGNYEFQVPIVVVTSEPPQKAPRQDENLTFTFVTDGADRALARAEAAASERAVTIVGGPGLIAELLLAGSVDELLLDLMPVLLGSGKRLFESSDLTALRMELIDEQRIGQRVTLRFQVRRR
jgi:dihydrofolate reductase